MHFNTTTITSIAVGIIALLGFSYLSFTQYETGSGQATKVQAEIIGHIRNIGSNSGAATADPMFIAILKSGLQIKVRDSRVIPVTYKGMVVLNRQKGAATGRFIYSINKSATEQVQLHNK
jgi:hypothetical protein